MKTKLAIAVLFWGALSAIESAVIILIPMPEHTFATHTAWAMHFAVASGCAAAAIVYATKLANSIKG